MKAGPLFITPKFPWIVYIPGKPIDMWDQVEQFFIPWLLAILFSVLIWILCHRYPKWGRRGLGLVWLVGGLLNVYLAWIYPRDYLVFGQFALFSFYRRFIYMILFRQAIWMGAILVVWHFYLAFQFFRPGPLSPFSLGVAMVLLLLLAPLGFGSGFPASLILLLGLYALYRRQAIE